MRYNTMREAAVAGLAIAIPKSFKEKVEYGGLVRKDEKGYYYDGIRTDYLPSQVNPTEDGVTVGDIKADHSIAAFFHTHVHVENLLVETFANDYFSQEDVIGSFYIEKPSYLGDAESGDVYELTDTDGAPFNMTIYRYKGMDVMAYKGEKVATVARDVA